MRRAYLDAQIFPDLLLPDRRYSDKLGIVRAQVASGRLKLFGSASILEELAPLYQHRPFEYRQMVGGAFELFGAHFLLPRLEISRAELRKRKQLTDQEATVPADILSQIVRTSNDLLEMTDIAREVALQKQGYESTFGLVGREAAVSLKLAEISAGKLRAELGPEWTITKPMVDDWIISSALIAELGNNPKSISTWQLPVTRSWYAYAIVRAFERAAESINPKASDRADWEHFAYAAVPGLLVTDDTRLRSIARRTGLGHVRAIDAKSFFLLI